jgi:hypothetical protein
MFECRTNVWFDFQNDVLWTLSEETRTKLVVALEGIKKLWADKAKATAAK